MEPDSAVYRALVESTQAIPWRIDWTKQKFTFIGPQIEQVLGWPQRSWRTVGDWAERIHPEDRDRVVQLCVSQSQSGVDHEADYRALRPDGSYVWIRDVVHVMREGDQIDALVGFMFDITDRKRQEQELLRAQRELEILSYQDELTGIPNRRMFEAVFEREWESARRSGRPIALVLIDVDHFKDYNDCLGHVAGDDCLRRVTELLSGVPQRPRDLVGRYGGEEFVVLLPEANLESARSVAERCRRAVEDAAIPHPHPDAKGRITISLGVGSVVPSANDDASTFVNEVDKLLYEAKRNGRNRVLG
jgi:diguanylate cyclase (GGDEF)-like protein/PAS domain S-box-containing protein